MTDERSTSSSLQPTKANMVESMKWLVNGARRGDQLFFHFSGHGTQVRDRSGDESDGFDESLMPVDYKKAGPLIDDVLHEIFVKNLPNGVRLTALLDCCHSGSLMDLPFAYKAPLNKSRAMEVPQFASRKTKRRRRSTTLHPAAVTATRTRRRRRRAKKRVVTETAAASRRRRTKSITAITSSTSSSTRIINSINSNTRIINSIRRSSILLNSINNSTVIKPTPSTPNSLITNNRLTPRSTSPLITNRLHLNTKIRRPLVK
eukprot:Selendium_serpulae@DN5536_c2_g1_i1.p1